MAVDDATVNDAITAPVQDDTKKGPDAVLESDSSSYSEKGRSRIKEFNECAFDTTEDPRFYKPIPEYEGIHRWDPDFDWTEEEEKRIIRKVSPISPSYTQRRVKTDAKFRLRSIGESAHLPASPFSRSSSIVVMSSKPCLIIC
jgi:hypothetical protein